MRDCCSGRQLLFCDRALNDGLHACRLCTKANLAQPWQSCSRWIQVQQLLARGPKQNAQAITAFLEVMRLANSPQLALAAGEEPFLERLLAIASSSSGLNRHLPLSQFVLDCRAVVERLERFIGEPDVFPGVMPWQKDMSVLECTAKCPRVKPQDKSALETFFMCGPL
jgi:hypothetical protein